MQLIYYPFRDMTVFFRVFFLCFINLICARVYRFDQQTCKELKKKKRKVATVECMKDCEFALIGIAVYLLPTWVVFM